MADLAERIVEINRRVWDEWPGGIDAGNVEEVRRAAATAVVAALEAEAYKGERRGLERAAEVADELASQWVIDASNAKTAEARAYFKNRHSAASWVCDRIRALIPEAPAQRELGSAETNHLSTPEVGISEAPLREAWQPIQTAPKGDPLRSILIATRGYVGGVVQVSWSETFWDFVDQDEDTYPDATHWMPLPAPPQDHREG